MTFGGGALLGGLASGLGAYALIRTYNLVRADDGDFTGHASIFVNRRACRSSATWPWRTLGAGVGRGRRASSHSTGAPSLTQSWKAQALS